jgi:two-component system response regulator NreC
MSEKYRIVLADDHKMLRAGLKLMIAANSEYEIAGEADNGSEALRLAEELKPDLILLDINMPEINGIEVARKIREKNKEIRILLLTMYDDETYVLDAVSAGINGYILKMSDMEELLGAIDSVLHGKDYYPAEISRIVMSGYMKQIKKKNETTETQAELTKREKEIVRLIAQGDTSQQIAGKLFISYFTVCEHRKNIMRKTGLKNQAEIVHYAINEKLI